jgi:prenyltransferase beta subunit
MNDFNRRRFLLQAGRWTAGVAGCWGVGSALALARDRGAETEKSAAEMVTPKTAQSIQKGLEFLGGRQHDDGSFGSGGYGRNVAVCALAGMAFVASGSTPGRGPYGRQVDRCLDFILTHTEESGFINVPAASSHGPMYGHGFATLFLAESYGMTLRTDIREKLTKAVELIVNTQDTEGGWRYQPVRHDADISVTVCELMALRAARNAGLFVPHETISRSIDFIKRCQNEDGGFMYMAQGGPSAFPRSAAGIVALYSAGIYEGPEIDKGLEYLTGQIPRGDDLSRESHYFYGHYYAVQAMWHAGGENWTRWYPAIRDALLKRQADDGSWLDAIGVEYGTSMATIILQMPNNYLPIFQR